MIEQWKSIDGYVGYEVSNLGRVRSFKHKQPRILKPSTQRGDYLSVDLCRDNTAKHYTIHRLVAIAFIPNPEHKPQVNHIDGNKLNNRADNLEWATYSENHRHAFDIGLKHTPKGEYSYRAKLTNTDVEFIRNHYKPRDKDFGTGALGRKFNVDPQTISNIVRGKSYANAGGKIAEKYEKRKLTPAQIREIRQTYVKGSRDFGLAVLAEKFGVAHSTIGRIVKNKLYKEVI